jgi:hypothetical protein
VVDIKNYFQIKNYTITNELISTDFNVALIKLVTKLPVQFGHVNGNFYCSGNKLTSLKGAPQTLSGYFDCRDNQLTSLEGSPKSVGGGFYCDNNPLISLEGAPQSVVGIFYLSFSENLPLLRLVRYQHVETFNSQVNVIIRKYFNHKPLKEAILLCQKELIDNGFIGNASW